MAKMNWGRVKQESRQEKYGTESYSGFEIKPSQKTPYTQPLPLPIPEHKKEVHSYALEWEKISKKKKERINTNTPTNIIRSGMIPCSCCGAMLKKTRLERHLKDRCPKNKVKTSLQLPTTSIVPVAKHCQVVPVWTTNTSRSMANYSYRYQIDLSDNLAEQLYRIASAASIKPEQLILQWIESKMNTPI